MLALYRFATWLGWPLVRLVLAARRRRGKEDPARFAERFGVPGRSRPAGRLVWLHAASVGESLSMIPLIERLLDDHRDIHVLATSGTVTSAALMNERLPARAFHQYVPVDRVACIDMFLDHWRPDLALWAESEFWPNLITRTHARGVPLVLVNGRVSPGAFAGWRRAPGMIARVLACFDLCLGQTAADAERLERLGARRFACLGNLKFVSPPLPADAAELETLERAFGTRPRWLAASTHPGEEEIAAAVHMALAPEFPGLVTALVPRHPERGEEIAARLRGMGLTVARRGAGEALCRDTAIYLADTLGELGTFFRLAGIVFMGKSLAGGGGQNPLEPLRLDGVVLHGPHMANFTQMIGTLDEAGAAIEVADGGDLAETVRALLRDPAERARRAAIGRELVEAEAEVLDAVAAEIGKFLNRGNPGTGAVRSATADARA
jgi:3-deoxy-D-manno-octulosonic-acid transferase